MLAPRFGLFTLVGLVVANMIGAGVFTTSGFALADLGTPDRVMLAWLTGGLLAVCGALSYGALVRRMTDSGGEYLFLSRAIHPAAGFVAGWVSLLAGFTGAIALAATALEAYLLPAGTRPGWIPEDALALTAVFAAGALHVRKVGLGAGVQNALVVLKLVMIGAITVFALAKLSTAGGAVGPPLAIGDGAVPVFEWSGFAVSLMWISLSYSGFNAAVYVAGEARDAKRQVPRALTLGTVVVTVIYLALNALFVYGAPPAMIAGHEDVAARALTALGGETLGFAMRGIVVLALATSVSSMIMAGPRVYARMADDGVLPRAFATRDGRVARAVTLQVVLAALIIVVSDLRELLSYLGFTLSVSAALTVSSLFVLRRREGAAAVPVPGYPWVPGLFVGATLMFAAIAAMYRPLEPVVGVATLATGVVAWLIIERRRNSIKAP